MNSTTDRIEKTTHLRAPRSRVWRALTNADEFGAWFRVKLDSGFAVGKAVLGQVTYPGYEHIKFSATVERLDSERLFSLRWHPAATGPESVSRLGAASPVSRQAIKNHLDVLARAGLVRGGGQGGEHIGPVEPQGLAEARLYLERISGQWDEALGRLKRFVEGGIEG